MIYLKESMQQTRFVDLSLQLNHPYLYAHCGGCEHVVYIRNIRKSMPGDECSIRCISKNRSALPICDMCELNAPVKLTWNDLFAPKSISFWCSTCFDEFHNDEDGNALYDFDSESVRIEF